MHGQSKSEFSIIFIKIVSFIYHFQLTWAKISSEFFFSVCILFIFFSRTTRPISIKLGTKYPWVKEIQVSSNEGPQPFQRGDNNETAKLHSRNLIKSTSPEPLGQFQPHLAKIIFGWRGFKFFQMKVHSIFQGEIMKILKIHWWI